MTRSEDTRTRLERISDQATRNVSQGLGFSINVFTRRGDGIYELGQRSGEWILPYWYRGQFGVDVTVIVGEDNDEVLREAIEGQIEARARLLREAELGGPLPFPDDETGEG